MPTVLEIGSKTLPLWYVRFCASGLRFSIVAALLLQPDSRGVLVVEIDKSLGTGAT
jgi:hypothetical protein